MNKQEAIAKARNNVGQQIKKYISERAVSKTPTGLSIKRSGNRFTFSWKNNGENYGEGLSVQYCINRPKKDDTWKDLPVSSNRATSAVLTIDPTKYYPTSGKPTIASVAFRVRGKQQDSWKTFSDAQKYTEVGKDKKKVEKTYKFSQEASVNPAWSEWAKKEFNIDPPKTPSISAAVSDTLSNVTTFSWSVATAADDARPFTHIQWQTTRLTDSAQKTGAPHYGGGGTTGASRSETIAEDSAILGNGHSHRRWVRVRAKGLGGASPWKEISHVYAQPNPATNVRASAVKAGGTFSCMASWTTKSSYTRPIDKISVQYIVAQPEAGLNCPSGLSWADGMDLAFKDGSDAAKFSVDDTMGLDECLFLRVNTHYDAIYDGNYGKTFGTPILVAAGKLKTPSGISVVTEASTHTATVTATNNSGVEGTFLAIIYKGAKHPNKQFVVGVIPDDETSTICHCPDWSGEGGFSFGVYAVAGTYTKQTRADGADSYSIKPYAGKPLMRSDMEWDGGEVPLAPTNVTVESTDVKGSVRVNWAWSWRDATGAEISWSDHSDAWESTDSPDSFVVSNMYSPHWNIAGLSLGTEWYIRVRFVRDVADTTVYSPWSELTSASTINLSSPPETPSLNLSSPFVIEGGEVTASWAYVSNDGTPQSFAEIRQCTINGETITYGRRVATTATEQSVVINATDAGWTQGNTYNLAVRVTSGSGKESEQWSAPVSITVVQELTCAITSTSLVDGVLTEMPLTVAVSHPEGVTHTLAIEREESYQLERPDESVFSGHKGETVAVFTNNTDGQFTIATDDLIGAVDDGEMYRIIVTSSDEYGQSASAEMTFTVGWTHQALMPTATAYVYDEDYASIIKTGKPEGALDTDVCDIYRLSVDKPQLIMQGAELGGWYVDPYPTIGKYGGHRVVFRTANGDYITADNSLAWVDVQAGDFLLSENAIIDFGGDRVELEYNIELSHQWQKDFKETKYLGGSVQGDWNPAVSRNSTVASVALDITDTETIEKMRRLSTYAGICHVRTPDGSSYFADVQVSEDSSYDTGHHVISYSLSITRVDPEDLEGMTYDEWCHISETATGDIASFDDAAPVPLESLIFHVEPVQAGSGDPSPDNIRPITGWTEIEGVISPTTDAEDGTLIPITFPSSVGTVYGGYVDVTGGKLVVDRAMVTYDGSSDEAWGGGPQSGWHIELSTMKRLTNYSDDIKCDVYPTSQSSYYLEDNTVSGYRGSESQYPGQNWLYYKNSTLTSSAEVKQHLSSQPINVCYPLAEPVEYDLTPQQVNSLLGENHIWCDSGETDATYKVDIEAYEEEEE